MQRGLLNMTSMYFFPSLIAQALLVPILAPLIIGVIRKTKAKLQGRCGASIVQPYRELWKLFHKDEVISEHSSWISRIAPYVVFGTTMVVALGIPLIKNYSAGPGIGDILTVIYLFALGVFFMALNGLDSGGGFGGLGSSREMTLAACAEAAFLFSLLFMGLLAHSTNLTVIVRNIQSLPLVTAAPLLLAALAFFVVLVSENARIPFDNPATHLELTMVHEAMLIETSGKSLALMEWGSWSKLFIFLSILGNVFFPWGLATEGASLGALFLALLIFLIKIVVGATIIAIIESSMAKFRYFRLPDLLFGSLILVVIALGIILQ